MDHRENPDWIPTVANKGRSSQETPEAKFKQLEKLIEVRRLNKKTNNQTRKPTT